jgi:glycine dehydrogenase subunit 2
MEHATDTHAGDDYPLIFEVSQPGRRAIELDRLDVPEVSLPDELCRDEPAALPELGELDVVRHFTNLSRRNFGIDTHFYPLGSCTMKYNPKLADAVAADTSFAGLHPHLATTPGYRRFSQGALEVVHEVERWLAEIGGMEAASLQPIAGAHGELAGTLMIAAYHRDHGNTHKTKVLIPDSAHGTNPASAAIAGFDVVEIPSGGDGTVDFDAFLEALTDDVAGIMLTCPNTHGLFEPRVAEIAERAHEKDALLYYDGANLNAIMGMCRPGDLGFDVMHFNLHKTFATPHGMGGPGAGPVGVGPRLAPYLPGPRVVRRDDGAYDLEDLPKSIGRMHAFFGNFLVGLRAYAYMLHLGAGGLRDVARTAVLNCNYVWARLREVYKPAFEGRYMHECVFTAGDNAPGGIRALDIAKALLDYGFHAPTVYFPLTVKESLMIEPTETESKETLEAFCEAMRAIAERAAEGDDTLHHAPMTLPVGRLDEVFAARQLNCAFPHAAP